MVGLDFSAQDERDVPQLRRDVEEVRAMCVARLGSGEHAQKWIVATVIELGKSPMSLEAGAEELADLITREAAWDFQVAFVRALLDGSESLRRELRQWATWPQE
jgi:hypothetical protein